MGNIIVVRNIEEEEEEELGADGLSIMGGNGGGFVNHAVGRQQEEEELEGQADGDDGDGKEEARRWDCGGGS